MSIENQAQLGACVSNSLTSMCEMLKKSLHRVPNALARMYHYLRGRSISATTAGKDGGMTLKQGMQAGKAWGICRESLWPYLPAKYNDEPPESCDVDAATHRITRYERLKGGYYQDMDLTVRRIKEALTLGYPVQLGFSVEDAFRYLTGPLPHNYAGMQKQGAVNIGGHAVVIVGYYQRGPVDYFKIANSWGTGWGDGGFAGLPMVTVHFDSFDIWAITEFDGLAPPAPEDQQRHTLISRLYVALFGRAPDAEGLGYWTSSLKQGYALSAIATRMFDVEPARAYYPAAASADDIARSFYYNVLGRAPDVDGIAYWSARIQAEGPGPVIAELTSVTANYAGSDAAGAWSSDRFNRRVRAARLYAENGGDVDGAAAAIAYVQ
jgi:hypothetical protein